MHKKLLLCFNRVYIFFETTTCYYLMGNNSTLTALY